MNRSEGKKIKEGWEIDKDGKKKKEKEKEIEGEMMKLGGKKGQEIRKMIEIMEGIMIGERKRKEVMELIGKKKIQKVNGEIIIEFQKEEFEDGRNGDNLEREEELLEEIVGKGERMKQKSRFKERKEQKREGIKIKKEEIEYIEKIEEKGIEDVQ